MPDVALRDIPLIVDVDGTLLQGDTLVEATLGLVARQPLKAFSLPGWLMKGRAALKEFVAVHRSLEPDELLWNQAVLQRIRDAKAQGRRVYLASGADTRHVRQIADALGDIDGCFASDGETNLTGTAKAERLCAVFGEKGFDYIGNERRDLDIWRRARHAIVVDSGGRGLAELARAIDPGAEVIAGNGITFSAVLKAMRPHQWLKNCLVFLPLIAAHLFTFEAFAAAFGAFLALSLVASGTYLMNDLLDLPHDRAHTKKANRPLASGALPVLAGLRIAPALVALGLVLAAFVGWPVLGLVSLYLVVTLAYSLYLKRRMFIDAVTLAGLFTTRVLAGAAAVAVTVSPWFLAFSMFLFLMLAIVKRYREIYGLLTTEKEHVSGRNYEVSDLPVLAALGAASGFSAVLVLALYLNNPEVGLRYAHPMALWLLCPLLIYWVGRVLMLTNRGIVDDDPLVFAATDRPSLGVALLCFIVFMIAL